GLCPHPRLGAGGGPRRTPPRHADGRATAARDIACGRDILHRAAPAGLGGSAALRQDRVRCVPHLRAGGDGGPRQECRARRCASVVTAAVVELLFEITPGQREALEGVTMLLATAVLFYVSYWLLSKIEVAKWNAFVKGRMEEALSTGSGFALASVAFLAVYRE